MSSPDDRWRPAPAARDIVESGPREWPAGRRRLGLAGLVVAALLSGLGAGYAAGSAHRPGTAAQPGRSRSATAGPAETGAAAVANGVAGEQGGQCSAQIGHDLQLGVQVLNQSAQSMILRQVRPVLPLGGLEIMTQAWGPCGELPTATAADGHILPAGGSAWFTVTFRVLVPCPAALPVQFAVTFAPAHQPAGQPGFLVTSRLPGFDDLGGVPYSGCPPAS